MLIPQELQLSRLKTWGNPKSCFGAQFENLGELVKNTIFVA